MITAEPAERGRRLPTKPSRRPRTAFVLSGGASRGAVQVGMLRALYEREITADMFVATSVGALNAAFLASRPQTEATVAELGDIWRGLRSENFFPLSLRALFGGLSGFSDHLVPAHRLRKIIARYLQFDDLADAATPLHLVAFDIHAGHEVLLSEGPAVDTVTAAASIPGVFPPVSFHDKRLIDGGVMNNTPISHAIELGAERIYVLPTQDMKRPLPLPRRSALDVAIYALGLLIDSRLSADIARHRGDVDLIVLPPANSAYVQPTDFGQADRLIAEAFAASRELLDEQTPVRRSRSSRRPRSRPALRVVP